MEGYFNYAELFASIPNIVLSFFSSDKETGELDDWRGTFGGVTVVLSLVIAFFVMATVRSFDVNERKDDTLYRLMRKEHVATLKYTFIYTRTLFTRTYQEAIYCNNLFFQGPISDIFLLHVIFCIRKSSLHEPALAPTKPYRNPKIYYHLINMHLLSNLI